MSRAVDAAALVAAASATVAVLAACGGTGAASHSAASPRGAASPTPAAPSPAPSPAAAATPAPAGVTLLDLNGSGSQSSSPFQAPSTWTLRYSYDCGALGAPGRFRVDIRTSDAQSDPVVLEIAATGTSSVAVHDSGSVRLEIKSQCAWHVTAAG
jgi:hypothetical protein